MKLHTSSEVYFQYGKVFTTKIVYIVLKLPLKPWGCYN